MVYMLYLFIDKVIMLLKGRVRRSCRFSVFKHLIVFVLFYNIIQFDVYYNVIVHGYIPVFFCIPALPHI